MKRDFARLLYGSAQQYLFTVLVVLSEFAFLFTVMHRADVATYGAIAFHIGVSFVVFQFLDFRATEVAIRFIPPPEEGHGTFTHSVAALCGMELAKNVVAGVLLLLVGSVMVAAGAAVHVHALLLVTVFQLLFYSVMGTTRGALRIAGRFAWSAAMPLIPSVCRLILIVALPGRFMDLQGLALVYALSGVAAVGYYLVALATIEVPPRSFWPPSVASNARSFWRRHASLPRYGRDMLVSSWAMVPTKELDVFLLGLFGGFQSVGLYKTAKNLYQAVWIYFDSIQVVCLPVFSRMASQQNWSGLWRLIGIISLTVGASAVALYGVIWLTGGIFLNLLIEDASQAVRANSLFRLMCLGVLAWGPFFWISPYLLALGRSEIFSQAALGTMVATGVGYLAAAWLGQDLGLAIATAASSPVALGLMLGLAHRAKLLSLAPAAASAAP